VDQNGSLRHLPSASLMSRVANRAIHYSQALREMERTSRIELKELEKARRKNEFGREVSSSVCPVPSFLRDSTLKHATRCSASSQEKP